jgi:hypothetical protein
MQTSIKHREHVVLLMAVSTSLHPGTGHRCFFFVWRAAAASAHSELRACRSHVTFTSSPGTITTFLLHIGHCVGHTQPKPLKEKKTEGELARVQAVTYGDYSTVFLPSPGAAMICVHSMTENMQRVRFGLREWADQPDRNPAQTSSKTCQRTCRT